MGDIEPIRKTPLKPTSAFAIEIAMGNSSASLPPQHQDHQPGVESAMQPRPSSPMQDYVGSGKPSGKVAVAFANEGTRECVALAAAMHRT